MVGYLLLLVSLISVCHLTAADSCPSVCLCSNVGNNADKLQVDCQHKNISIVPKDFNTKTEVLKLNGNSLTSLQAEAFKTENLKNLHLRFNDIATVHRDAFKNLKHLQVLAIDYNQIDSLHPETFKYNSELEIISLSHNPISRLEDGLFTNKSELSSVEVENCKLSYIGPKTFDNVPNLLYLYLNGNNLVSVDFTTLLPISGLRIILHDNPWKCDCKLKPFRDSIVKRTSESNIEWYKDHSPLCAQPPRLANKTWIEIKPEEFTC